MWINRILPAVLLAVTGVLPVVGQAIRQDSGYKPDAEHILVTFNAPAPLLGRRAGSGFKGYGNTAYATHATARYLTRELADQYSLQVIDDWPMDVLSVHCVLYRLPDSGEPDRIIAALRLDPRVESVQRMQHFRLQSAAPVYNDPYHQLQRDWWGASLAAAHRLSTGKNVKVGIIDTAVERGHQDLRAALAAVKRFVPDERSSEGDYHGTSVAGIIAAQADNGVGIVGVAPDAKLYSLEACWSTRRGYAECDSFTLAKALSWAIDENLQVVNLSLAGPDDPLLRRLIDAALKRGISVVAADGARDGLSFPASVPGVIAVREAEEYDASRRSGEVLYAPGRDIMTTVPWGTYDFVSGSSMSAAHVSGLVALLLSYDPSLSGARVQKLLEQALNVSQDPNGKTAYASIDACSLLVAADVKKRGIVHSCTPPVLVSR